MQVTHSGGEWEAVGCSQSVIHKRKVHCVTGTALNMPANGPQIDMLPGQSPTLPQQLPRSPVQSFISSLWYNM